MTVHADVLSSVDTVLLDMDGTLLDLRYDNAFWFEHLPQCYAEARDMAVAEARREIQQRSAAVAGTLEFYCMDYWSEMLGLDVAALNEELAHLIRFRPQVLEFLAVVRVQGKRAILVTNSHARGLAFKLEQTGLDEHLDRSMCAHELGYPKERQAFWARVQRETGFAAAKTLLIDDNEAVLASAERFGVGSLLAVAQPDLSLPARTTFRYPLLQNFRQLYPDVA